MAEIKLELVTNAQEGIVTINQLSTSVSELNTETKTFQKTSDAAFASATNDVEELNTEIKKGTKSTEDLAKGAKAVGASGNRIKELKKEIKDLTSEAFKAGEGTATFTAKLKEAGKLTDELGDLNAALGAVAKSAGENVAGAFGEATSIGIAGFEGVTAAQSLLGIETENVEKQLLKLQSIKSLGNVVKEFAGLGDKITEIKLGLTPLTDAFSNQASNIANGYSTANESLKNFGKNFSGNITSGIKSLGANVSGFFTNFGTNAKGLFSSLGSGIKSFSASGVAGIKALGAALTANPLGIILVVIGAVIAIFVALKDKIKPVAAVFEFLSSVISAAGDALHALGEALGLVASEQEENSKAVIANTEKEVEAISKRYERELKLAKAAGKETEDIEKQKLKAEATRVAQSIAELERLNVIQGKLDEEQLKEKEKLQEKFKDLITDLSAVTLEAEREKNKKIEEENKKRDEAQKKRNEERKKNLEALNAALIELEKKSEQAILNTLAGEEKIKKQRQISIAELNELQKSIEAKSKLAGQGDKLGVKQLEEISKIKSAIEKQYTDDIIKLRIEEANATAAAGKKAIDNDLKNLELRQKLAEQGIKAEAPPADATADEIVKFEEAKAKKILEIQKFGAASAVQIKQDQIEAERIVAQTALDNELELLEGKEDAISKARQEAIVKEKAILNENATISKQIVVAETEETVNAINAELNKLGTGIEPKPLDLAALLGVDEKDKEKFYSELASIGKSVQSILSSIIDQEIESSERAIDASKEKQQQQEDELSALEDKLSKEQELKDEGFANDTKRTEDEIARKNAEIEAEKAREAALIEERKKQQKIKLAIDSATQVSNIITAGSTLFAEGAFKGPVGIATAAATILGMVAAFFALRQQLAAINSEGFEEGGYTGDIGTKEVAGQVHGREFVMNAKHTDKYFDLFQGIHTGDKKLMELGLSDLLKDTGVVLPKDISQKIKSGKDSIKSSELKIVSGNNNSGVEVRLDKLEKHLVELIEQGKISETALTDGSIMTKKGSHTSIIRNGRK